ncbi:MAG TPA: flagellar basal body-associated FliL family protein [Vicinamibacterales bacterium]|nr:flagellar basal body-associated FliL family protein [Vicinamibacterales bacterium]
MSDAVETNEGAEGEVAAPPRKKKSKRLFIVIAVVVLLGGGAGAWWMLRGRAAEAAPERKPAAHERGLVKFDPFVVNLTDGDGSRYLRVAVQIVVASEEEGKHISESEVLQMQARSAILEVLSQQSSTALLSAEGKAALRKTIAEKVAGAFDGREVIDVLFSEFVVQY